MEESYAPRRHQTRLANKSSRSLTGSTGEAITMEYIDSNLPLERTWTHTSQILSPRKKDTEQILLDQLSLSAQEVQDTKSFERHFNFFRGPLNNYSSIRETYQLLKESSRQNDVSVFEQVYKSPILFMTKLMLVIRTFFRSTKRILVVTFLDFIMDLMFCLAYLVEVQMNFYYVDRLLESDKLTHVPIYLRVFRTETLFTVIFSCAIWNLASWVLRMTYVIF